MLGQCRQAKIFLFVEQDKTHKVCTFCIVNKMPLFSTPHLKKLPRKLRQIISARDEMEVKASSVDQKYIRSFSASRSKRSRKKTLRSPNRQVTLDSLAQNSRSRPPSAAAKRAAKRAASRRSNTNSNQVPEVEIISRHESAPSNATIKDMNNTTIMKNTATISQSDSPLSLITKPTRLQRGGSTLSLAADFGHRAVSMKNLIPAKNKSVRNRSSPLARRRSSISMGGSSPKGTSDRKAKSKKNREIERREERRRVNDKLRAVLGAMTHRKLASGWHAWHDHIQAHRHKDLASSAMTILQHIEPNKRNPAQIKTAMKWICQTKLPCLRPLVEGHTKGLDGHDFEDEDVDSKSCSLLAQLCKSCELKKYNKGEIMFWQTEFGEHYYIVVEGGVGIYAKQERGAAAKLAQHTEQLKKDGHASTDWSVPAKKKLLGRWILDYGPGTGFGELALVSWDRERKASAVAVHDNTYVLLVHRHAYNKCLWHLHQADRNLDERVAWLQSIDHFKQWEEHRLAQFAYELKESIFHRGDLVIKEGDSVNSLVLLRSGMCQGFIERRGEGTRNEIPLALYEPGTFLGQTDLAVSSSRQRPHQMNVRSLSSSDIKVYYIPRESYIKFVLKITDATTSQLKRRLIDLAGARDQQIEVAIRCSQTTETMSRKMSPLRPSKKEQLRRIERSSCGGAPSGMPERAQNMFGSILLSMTPSEQRTVQEECPWSRSTDLPRQIPSKESNSNSSEMDERNEENRDNEETEASKKIGGETARSSTAPLKAARAQRKQKKKAADETGTQYGTSKHATEDDDMWGLMSDTMIMKNNGPKKSSLRLSPVRKRPNTAPSNPFQSNQGPPYMEDMHRLRLGISSPSFYKSRNSRSGIKKPPLE